VKREDHPLNDLPQEPDWTETEKRLELQYITFFQQSMSMPEEVAREIFKTFAQEQKEAARREGTDHLPESFGAILLEREQTDEEVRAIRSRGKRHRRDIAFWWNMRPGTTPARSMVDRILLFEKFAHAPACRNRKRRGWWQNRSMATPSGPRNRGRPAFAFELKWRQPSTERAQNDPEKFHEELEASTSECALQGLMNKT
jgi:hypothetical protein